MANKVQLNGQSLSIQEVIRVACQRDQVDILEEALEKVRESRAFVEHQVEAGKLIYGINTGLGSNASTVLENEEDMIQLQKNLLLSHACGVGKMFSAELVRAIMLIRLNTLLAGYSGIQEETLILLKDFLNHRIHPLIPSQGSVGASGDLCPLSHMALALIGEGKVEVETEKNGKISSQTKLAKEALTEKKLKAINPKHKEGIALNNGTTVMAALGVMSIYEGRRMMRLATLSSCLVFEAFCARKDAFEHPLHEIRRHSGQKSIATWIRENIQGSEFIGLQGAQILQHLPKEIIENFPFEKYKEEIGNFLQGTPRKFSDQIFKYLPDEEEEPKWRRWETLFKFAEKKITPQDSYSIRCTPQVLGASLHALLHAQEVIEGELNAVVDNPIIFVEDEKILSGGNFHGQPIALVLDYMKLAFAEVGNLLERQINKLIDPATNDALPPFLVENSGLNSGWMIPQYVAASLVSENKVLVHPASADSIPTSANQEDHVSMGTIAGRQAIEIQENIKKIITILMLTAAQAVDMRRKQLAKGNVKCKMGKKTQELYQKIREYVPYLVEDRLLYEDIELVLQNFEDFYTLIDEEAW